MFSIFEFQTGLRTMASLTISSIVEADKAGPGEMS